MLKGKYVKINTTIVILLLGILIIRGSNIYGDTCSNLNDNVSDNIHVLVIVPDRFGLNGYFNLGFYERFGWNITITGTKKILDPCPYSSKYYGSPPITVDIPISDITDISKFDAIVISRGYSRDALAYEDLLQSSHALKLISSAVDIGIPVCAGCGGVRVLAKAGVLNGVQVQGPRQYKGEIEAAGGIYVGNKLPPVIDGNIITTMRGMYYSSQNCQALALLVEKKDIKKSEHLNIKDEKYTNNQINQHSSINNGWIKLIGSTQADGGRSMCIDKNGDIIIVGYTFSLDYGTTDVYVLKTSSNGEVLWSNTFGSYGWEYGNDVCLSNDDGYLITGYTTSTFNDTMRDVYVFKISSDGELIWENKIGGPLVDVGTSICCADDEYLIGGYTESYGVGEDDLYLIKIDEQGSVLWIKTFGGIGPETAGNLISTSDNNYVIVGGTGSFNTGNLDIYVVKFNGNGDELWSKYLGIKGAERYDKGLSICELSDGGFLIVGEAFVGGLDIEVIKIDSEGNQEWVKFYDDTFHDYGIDVTETDDGGFLLCGTIRYSEDIANTIIMKLDYYGNELWRKIIGGSESEWSNALIEQEDGSILLIGQTASFCENNYDVMIININGSGDDINEAPSKPSIVAGRKFGITGRNYEYSCCTFDINGDDIFYLFDWGDGSDSIWLGPFESEKKCSSIHSWEESGDYLIKVKARDVYGGESEWSDPLEVILPKYKMDFLSIFKKNTTLFSKVASIMISLMGGVIY